MQTLPRPLIRFSGAWLLVAYAAISISCIVLQSASVPQPPTALPDTTLPHITEELAVAIALNDFQVSPGKVRLQHPRHQAVFTQQGVAFTPKGGGPEWRWQLSQVRMGSDVLEEVALEGVLPTIDSDRLVRFERGPIIEQYVAKANSIEQQFILPKPLLLAGEDLVIVGQVTSAAQFAAEESGWRWYTTAGAVTIGSVFVFDATGIPIPATMRVTPTQTEIQVASDQLSRARYPVVIDPEIGANDFRLSDMGGDVLFDAFRPAVAYNQDLDEYLVVWDGDDNTGSLMDQESEIYGQRVAGATGAEIGSDFRLSDMGPDGDLNYDAFNPDVAYNSTQKTYLVVWQGDDDTGALSDEEYEIYGQLVEANTGAEIGSDVRLSDMGPIGSVIYDAFRPAVAYNPTQDEFLVVWHGDSDTGILTVNENEIFGQRVVGATGAEIGADDFRLSDMGPYADTAYSAFNPDVAYNSIQNEYLVVWQGEDDTGALVDDEFEIYGQRVAGATGAETGANDFRLSDMGPDGNAAYDATRPMVAYNPDQNEYLVVWSGDDNTGPLVEGENEVFGQRVAGATGTELGSDLRLSDMGPNGDPAYDVFDPRVAYNPAQGEYLVVWWGDDDTDLLGDNEFEIFGQRVMGATGAEIGSDLRFSDMGPDGDPNYDAANPTVVFNPTQNEYLVVWNADDSSGPLVDEENEVFGQRVMGATGAQIGANDFLLSDMGSIANTAYSAFNPAVAYNPSRDMFLVVWQGADNTGALVEFEVEIFGQLVDAATGLEIGSDVRLSDMGPDGDPEYDAIRPAVAYNPSQDEYLVVWQGDDNTGFLVNDEFEIYAQRVAGATGAEIGSDFRLSDMGPDGLQTYDARTPAVVYNSSQEEYLVVWEGDDDTGPLVNDESEIFGQRVAGATGSQIGSDFRLSDMGPDGDPDYRALAPAVAYSPTQNEYLVVWSGDDNTGLLVNDELEIFGQRVAGVTGLEIGSDVRLSDMGADGDPEYDAINPAVAYNSARDEYLVVWAGDDNTVPLVDGETEIFSQRVSGATGAEIGSDVRLSDRGPSGDPDYDAFSPAVAYNPAKNEYLVVWHGDDTTGLLVNDESEIFGQRVSGATGAEIGSDFRLSDMGPDGDPEYDAFNPDIAYNSSSNEYLVVWYGDDNTGPLVDDEYEVFGQRVTSVFNLFLPVIQRE